MQVEVITGPDKTTKLQEVQNYLCRRGLALPIFTGNRWTTPYFIIQLKQYAKLGIPNLLADDCTRQQIQAVLELQQDEEQSDIPEDFVIHLGRQA